MFIKKLLKKRRSKKRKKILRSIFKDILILSVALGFFTVGSLLIWATTLKTPDLSAIGTRKNVESTKIYDRTGEILLYDIHENVKQTEVDFFNISRHVKNATVAIEDAEFYEHIGIRPLATFRAVFLQPLRGKGVQGGSTITQQVVKNTLLTSERTVSRKLKEWVISIKLEREFSKEEILALYLNETPYGGNLYGIEEASLAFFGKQAKDITLPEAAYLAALPQRPTILSPYGNHTNLLEERKNLVLGRMYDLNFISEDEYNEALITEVEFQPRSSHGIKAPHFVTWVRDLVANEFGERSIQEKGYRVITTLDYELQAEAEKIVDQYAEENEVKFNAKNAGMVGIDPKTGEILIMVGSRDYFDVENDGNFNTTLSKNRQPGSSFKPFVYATAFMKGYTPDTVLFNVRTQFSTTCDTEGLPLTSENSPKSCFMPENYDHVYGGPITLRNALAQSVNIPAVKLLYLTGIANSIKTAESMGITSLTSPDEYGLTLVLGSGGVSPLEMTSAYGVFANNGKRAPYQNLLRIEDVDGNIIRTYGKNTTQVIPENIALQISDVLSDNTARTPAFGARSFLYFEGRDVAVKTGTTNEYRDAWIIGYTPSFALGTWVGNNDNSPMEKKVAGFIVAPMWNAVMQKVLEKYPDEKFQRSEEDTTIQTKPVFRGIWEGGEQYFIDAISKKLATERTPEGLVIEKVNTDIHSILHWVNKEDPHGPQPSNPGKDPQYLLWESPIQKWAQKNGYGSSTQQIVPTQYDDVHTEENSPKITIIKPTKKTLLLPTRPYSITISYQNTYPITYVDYFINNVFMGRSEKHPYQLTFTPNSLDVSKGTNLLKAVIHDSVLNETVATTEFVVQ